MSKIKFTKGELKRQRDSLKQFQHYLPTLQLKKQQLQMKILEVKRFLSQKAGLLKSAEQDLSSWIGLLADPELGGSNPVDIKRWVLPAEIKTGTVNIAGANVPVLEDVLFAEQDYDYYLTPFWIDRGILKLQEYIRLMIEVQVIRQQIATLQRELRVTTQRVNLFEKIKIPECQENIRRIRIYLGDQQANAVGVSKVAKRKLEDKAVMEVAFS